MDGVTRTSGMSSNVAGGVAYLTIIPAIIFLIVEPYKSDSFVRFHSWQCIILFIASFVLQLVAHFIPFIGWAIGLAISLLVFIAWLIAMINAFQGKRFKLPFIGDLAAQQAGSLL